MKNGLGTLALTPFQVYPCPTNLPVVSEQVWPPISATSGQFFTLLLANSLLKALKTLTPPLQLVSLWKGKGIYWLLTVCLTMLICLYLVISTKYLNKIYFLSVCMSNISKMWNNKMLSNFINDQEPKCILMSMVCLPSLYLEEFVFSFDNIESDSQHGLL